MIILLLLYQHILKKEIPTTISDSRHFEFCMMLLYSSPKYCSKTALNNISSEIGLTLDLMRSISDSLILLKLPCLSCLHIKQSPAIIVFSSRMITLGSKPITQPSSLQTKSISSVRAVHSINPPTNFCSASSVFWIGYN